MRTGTVLVTLAAIPLIATQAPVFGLARLHLGGSLAASRSTRALPLCPMPVSVPDLARSERMPGSHAPAVVGTEAFGCTNPLGPHAAAAIRRSVP
jgi:hypothetical protein